ncbi:MAG: glycine cleavage system protein GcvH [Planctomycetota bacterium]
MDLSQLRYADTHEWVAVSEDNGVKIATIGISAHAVQLLTDLVYMDLPEVGENVTAGEEFGEVESVKAVSPLYCPVDGEIVDVHSDLPDNLEILSEDPYEQGWILKVKLGDETALAKLMSPADYERQCNEAG